MREAFVDHKFSAGSKLIIGHANRIISEYQAQGFILTLRQLYYQFVSRDLIPNKKSEYKRIGSVINDARLAGLIDWSAIEDRTRNLRKYQSWPSPKDWIDDVSNSYRENLWKGQLYRPEVWIEKDALLGVVEPACSRFRVPHFACRGYSSQSEQYAAGKRFSAHHKRGRRPIIFHLGDHDPSGMDMTRDNSTRLAMFARYRVTVKRLALNWGQIEQYNPPPNPAKETDSRAAGYIEKYGHSSWELDALNPTIINDLLVSAINAVRDPVTWESDLAAETAQRRKLRKISRYWSEIETMLEGRE